MPHGTGCACVRAQFRPVADADYPSFKVSNKAKNDLRQYASRSHVNFIALLVAVPPVPLKKLWLFRSVLMAFIQQAHHSTGASQAKPREFLFRVFVRRAAAKTKFVIPPIFLNLGDSTTLASILSVASRFICFILFFDSRLNIKPTDCRRQSVSSSSSDHGNYAQKNDEQAQNTLPTAELDGGTSCSRTRASASRISLGVNHKAVPHKIPTGMGMKLNKCDKCRKRHKTTFECRVLRLHLTAPEWDHDDQNLPLVPPPDFLCWLRTTDGLLEVPCKVRVCVTARGGVKSVCGKG